MSTKNELTVFNKSIAIPGVSFTRTALRFDAEVTPELLVQVGSFLQAVDACSAWWWGDFLVAYCGYTLKDKGEERVDEITKGDKEKQYTARYAEISGKEATTLKNWRSVAAFFNSSRRRDELSHGHHIEAKDGSGGDSAIADDWLDKAIAGGWSCSKLRAEIRRANRAEQEPDEPMPQLMLPMQVVECALWATRTFKKVDDMERDERQTLRQELAPVRKILTRLDELDALDEAIQSTKESITQRPVQR